MKRHTTRAAVIVTMFLLVAPAVIAATPPTTDLTQAFRGAAAVNGLQVYEISGIVIIRGRTADPAEAEKLTEYARTLGYQRVANLVQTVQHDDARLARRAERELTVHRALEGCRFHVRSQEGVLHVDGQVRHELQKDVAMQVLRTMDGVLGVQMQLRRF